jgi:hypothetical protein
MRRWVAIPTDLASRPETWELREVAGLELAEAAGIFSLVLLTAANHAEDGDLSALRPRMLAASCGWKQDHDRLFSALQAAGILDQESRIVGWSEYYRCAKERDKKRRQRGTIPGNSGNVPGQEGDCPGTLTGQEGDCPPLHNITEQNRTKETLRASLSVENPPGFATQPGSESENGKQKRSEDPPNVAALVSTWNENRGQLASVTRTGKTRAMHAATRLRETPSLEYWREIIRRLARSSFATGQRPGRDGKLWSATFAWLVRNDENHVKIAEGVFDDRGPQPQATKPKELSPEQAALREAQAALREAFVRGRAARQEAFLRDRAAIEAEIEAEVEPS